MAVRNPQSGDLDVPFIEVVSPQGVIRQPQSLARDLTQALVDAWGVSPEIVTTYVHEVPQTHYAHAGVAAPPPEAQRVFVKLHAFPRDHEAKRRAAASLTQALETAVGSAKNIAVYFFDRAPSDVAHGGRLESDKH